MDTIISANEEILNVMKFLSSKSITELSNLTEAEIQTLFYRKDEDGTTI